MVKIYIKILLVVILMLLVERLLGNVFVLAWAFSFQEPELEFDVGPLGSVAQRSHFAGSSLSRLAVCDS